MLVVEHDVMGGYTSWVVAYLVLLVTVVVLEHSELVELIPVHVVWLQLYLAITVRKVDYRQD